MLDETPLGEVGWGGLWGRKEGGGEGMVGAGAEEAEREGVGGG